MELYKYDTHVHTAETSRCGKVDAVEVVRLYKEAGYDGIFITDHYNKDFFEALNGKSWKEKMDQYLTGYHLARREGERVGLQVFLGIEIRFDESANDYLVYGLNEDFLRENEALYRLDVPRFRELIKDKGILIFQAHPFRPEMVRKNLSLLDGLEVYNGNPRQHNQNHLAYACARENKLKMLSGTDFHQVYDLDTRGGVEISKRIEKPEEFVALIRQGRIAGLIQTQ